MVRYQLSELIPIELSPADELALIDRDIALKRMILTMITRVKSGHPGGSLSCTQILLCLYRRILHHDPLHPEDPQRDRLILSKGHAAPALYAILAQEGYFSSAILDRFREFGSPLQGHPKRHSVPGIEISTGSLGMGAAMAVGIALGAKLDKASYRIYAILGDGECNEGVIWETAMAATHYSLDNLVFIIDRNAVQLDGPTEKIMNIEPLVAKWDAFGWNVIEIDGTSFRELLMALETTKQLKGRPTVIVAYTIKGQGVSFMQHLKEFHGKAPTPKEFEIALKDLEDFRQRLIQRINGSINQSNRR
jgi:transketolase